MSDSTSESVGSIGFTVRDAQDRLKVLGFELGEEAHDGVYGPKTAAALAAFKLREKLPADAILDVQAWSALVDASKVMGERLLFLHMPFFSGSDVETLQHALAVLGFFCSTDGIFDASTEDAVRDFQRNMALVDNGIVGHETVQAIERLRHAWDGKSPIRSEGRQSRMARSAEALASYPLCFFGTSALTRGIAERISNLAQATTRLSQAQSAASLTETPSDEVLLVGLGESAGETARDSDHAAHDRHQVVYDDDMTLAQQVGAAVLALESVPAVQDAQTGSPVGERRLFITLAPAEHRRFAACNLEQHCAVMILDALCAAASVIISKRV
ncbi:MAG: peptidoglycan-binding protein [Coriobacteriales bacterium]|jgi:hypothetical protein|nr:peptidoglycan-binding protein [Coriobacteriales bacterium]